MSTDIIKIGGNHIPVPEFDATIREADITDTDYVDAKDNPRKALHLCLETEKGYERHTRYTISDRSNSKWASLMKALGDLGITSIKAEDLVGKRFKWREEQVEYGGGITGNLITPIERLRVEKQATIEEPQQSTEKGVEPEPGSQRCADLVKEALKEGKQSRMNLGTRAREAGCSAAEFRETLSTLTTEGEVVEEDGQFSLW